MEMDKAKFISSIVVLQAWSLLSDEKKKVHSLPHSLGISFSLVSLFTHEGGVTGHRGPIILPMHTLFLTPSFACDLCPLSVWYVVGTTMMAYPLSGFSELIIS